MAIVPFLILFSLLVFVHEGGHFLLSKLFGVKVREFGFGYPPRVWGKKIKGTLYSVNLIPFGGFARIKGTEGEVSGIGDADSFAVQPLGKRVLITCGGVLGNFVLAWFLFAVLLIVGNPAPAGKVYVDEVRSESPAALVGISAGDYITSFGGEKVETADELISLTKKNAGSPSVLEVERGGERWEVTAVPRADPPEGEGPLGFVVSTAVAYEKVAVWKAPFTAFAEATRTVGQMLRFAFKLVGDLIRGEEVLLGGPVAIFALTETYVSYGLKIFIQFIALLSVNLVVVNLFPIPALDGGRLLFVAAEIVRGKKVSPQTEQFVNSLGFAFLIFLMILLTIHDIQTFF
jgi:regulator of sigma E protease